MTNSRTCHVRAGPRACVPRSSSPWALRRWRASCTWPRPVVTRPIGSSCGCSSCAPWRSSAGRQWSARPAGVLGGRAGHQRRRGPVWAGPDRGDPVRRLAGRGRGRWHADLAAALRAAGARWTAGACSPARCPHAITPMWAGALAMVALLGTMPALRADHPTATAGTPSSRPPAMPTARATRTATRAPPVTAPTTTTTPTATTPTTTGPAGRRQATGTCRRRPGRDGRRDPAGHGHTTEGTAPHDHPPDTEGDPHADRRPPPPHDHPDEPTAARPPSPSSVQAILRPPVRSSPLTTQGDPGPAGDR